jgi:hypothetical protein
MIMLRSGLIIGAVMLVVGGILAFLFPLCVPCVALLAGAGAGYLTGLWDRPADNGQSIQRGAGAGAIGGVGALIGHLAGAGAAAAMLGPQAATDMMRQFGLDTGTGVDTSPVAFYGGALATGCCFGLFEVALMAGLGALGGMLWWQMTGSKGSAGSMTPPSMPA